MPPALSTALNAVEVCYMTLPQELAGAIRSVHHVKCQLLVTVFRVHQILPLVAQLQALAYAIRVISVTLAQICVVPVTLHASTAPLRLPQVALHAILKHR